MNDFDFADDLKALGEAQHPSDTARERLLARVSATRRAEPRRTRGRRASVTVALAAAAAVLLTVWGLWPPDVGPAPPNHTVVVSPVPSGMPTAIVGNMMLNHGVEATAVSGGGQVTTDGQRTEVDWTEGEIALDVQSAPGRSVSVETEEAVVRVVGTALSVERGPFGTAVEVDHGEVVVTCRALQTPETLTDGEHTVCLRDAGAGLGHVLFLERNSASAEERLQMLERSLAHPTGLEETRLLLRERRIVALVELGRVDEAIAAAKDLDAGSRTKQLQQGANDAMVTGGCAQADPWLATLADLGDATGALVRVKCFADNGEPHKALEVLDRLDPLALSAPHLERYEAWREVLRDAPPQR
ncbi:MAG: FecR family protein [Myxococcales bacterium]|nr:FecR family protein [Myxococcales bacterium]